MKIVYTQASDGERRCYGLDNHEMIWIQPNGIPGVTPLDTRFDPLRQLGIKIREVPDDYFPRLKETVRVYKDAWTALRLQKHSSRIKDEFTRAESALHELLEQLPADKRVVQQPPSQKER